MQGGIQALLCRQAGLGCHRDRVWHFVGRKLVCFPKMEQLSSLAHALRVQPLALSTAKASTQALGRLGDCPCSQTLPAAATGAIPAHDGTSSPWVAMPAECPDLPWLRLGCDHCPRPFPQLARDAKIRPKISEGNRSCQGNYNKEQVKSRRSTEETAQHGSWGFFPCQHASP